MDESVKAALAKWPNVPHCYGWLGLDERGRWWMRDLAAQAAGPFAGSGATPESRGTLLRHEGLIAFIGRNYEADAEGQWFFQNGPQRVYVELAATPWIWRLQPDGRLHTHTGVPAGTPQQALLDEQGRLYLATPLGLGLVHSQDVPLAAQALEEGRWGAMPLHQVQADELPQRYGFVRSPARQASACSANR
ncbi:hypothetical protein Talka_00663 [Tepidimonas alkaliphilus]|uniref:DUF2946 domain-containing protein n=1 Tax=Tepidimonas alkaliphilus TaxID=2588942 RepID=A0A554WBQ0_9BURK|nr:DUF2946 family protein [Tepidimonas alkaliphilus]TSE20999.1 hypothetical protein Talka_00663 [Tepidimonas alkaliphilus]